MTKVTENTLWKIVYFALYYSIILFLYKWHIIKQDYFLNLLFLLIGFSVTTIRTIIYCYRENRSKRNRDLIFTYLCNYPLTIFISFNIFFPLIKSLSIPKPYDLLFSMAVFVGLGLEIDDLYNKGKILSGVGKYIKEKSISFIRYLKG